MDYKNQQYVRTRRRTSRDTPRRTQSTRNQAPRRDEGPHDDRDRGRGRTQNSRPQAPQGEEEEYYSEDEYPQPPRRDERPPLRREERAPPSHSERPPPPAQQRYGREGAPRPQETRESMAQGFDPPRQAQHEPRGSGIERERVFVAEPRGPPPNLGRENSRRNQAPMPAPLNVPRQGFRPEMREEQVCGRFPPQMNNGASADFGNSMSGVQAHPGPSRRGATGGGGDARELGPSVVEVESCPNCGYCLRGNQIQQPQLYVTSAPRVDTGAGPNQIQSQQPFARIPVMRNTSNERESQLPFPCTALPKAMQSTNMGHLPAHLQPTSSRTPQRPDSPYPNDTIPRSAVRPAQPATVPPRSAQRTEMPDRMIRPEPWIGNRQPSPRREAERAFRFQDPAVQTRGRTAMPDPMIRVHAQSPSRSRSRAERTVRLNTPVVQSPRIIHPSRQPRGPPPEPCRSARPLVAASNVVQGFGRGNGYLSV